MDELVYRRLCMTSVCGAILIPVAMALVSGFAAQNPVTVTSQATSHPIERPSEGDDTP